MTNVAAIIEGVYRYKWNHDANDRRIVFSLHGRTSDVRYALINTGSDWLMHRVKEQ